MYLQELKHTPEFGEEFGPTRNFRKFYGNYCGPGNCGGDPIDAIDALCRNHDECYHYMGIDNIECDRKFLDKLNAVLATKLTFKQRTAAIAMKLYFKRKLAKSNTNET